MVKLSLPIVVLFALVLRGQISQPLSSGELARIGNQAVIQHEDLQTQSPTNPQGTQASPLWVNVHCSDCPNPMPKADTDKPENDSTPKWRNDPNWWVAIFTIVLAFIAAIQACLFFYQLKIMARSLEDSRVAAEAAKAAAEAAKRSADIATNSERAWIITSQVKFSSNWPDLANQGAPEKSKILIEIHNSGRSPAEIESTHVVAIVFPTGWQFPDTPVYGDTEEIFQITAMPGEIISADEKRSMLCRIQHVELLTNEQVAEIMRREKTLYCYGRVRYKDISGSQRETHFGYYFYVRENTSDDRPQAMYRLGNRAYNFTT